MALFLAPILNTQQEDANGAPLSGGTVEVYLAGTSTPSTTYSDKAGLVPNTWPIVLNTLGVNNQGAVWLTGGAAYKFVIKNSLGIVQRTIDNVSGINDTAVTTDQWVVYQAAPTYVSSTSFTVAGDQTQTFQINRRLKTTNTGGVVYSTITNSVYSSPNTTVTVVNDSGVLDSGLSSVSYGIISVLNTSLPPGRLARVTVYTRIAGVQNIAVDGGAPTPTGAATFNPHPSTRFLVAHAQAGGGAGGGAAITTAGQAAAGIGGTAGTFAQGMFSTGYSGIAVAVGAGGVPGAAGNVAGGAGGSSSFGALLVSPGGPGGGGGAANAAALTLIPDNTVSGAPTGANLFTARGQGSGSLLILSATQVRGGTGGASFSGVGGQAAAGGAGQAAVNSGSGGGGAGVGQSSGANYAGGAGADGYVIVYEYA